jgi:hypothetical protein
VRATVSACRGEEGKGRGGKGGGERRGDTPVTTPRGETELASTFAWTWGRWRPQLRAEGRLRRAGKASRGRDDDARRLAAESWKRGEPQGRERVATHAHGIGGGNRRGGGRPRGRNADGRWQARLEGAPARGSREWTPMSPERRRVDLWTTPGEAVQSGDRLDRRTGRCRERRHRRSGGSRRRVHAHSRAARTEVLEGERVCASRPVNARRAVVKPIITTSSGYFPPTRRVPRKGRIGGVGARDVPRSARRRDDDLEGPVNPIPDRLPGWNDGLRWGPGVPHRGRAGCRKASGRARDRTRGTARSSTVRGAAPPQGGGGRQAGLEAAQATAQPNPFRIANL